MKIRSLGKKLAPSQKRILNLMKDRRWHKAGTILMVSGCSDGMRLMRGLRDCGYEIEINYTPRGRDNLYRIIAAR